VRIITLIEALWHFFYRVVYLLPGKVHDPQQAQKYEVFFVLPLSVGDSEEPIGLPPQVLGLGLDPLPIGLVQEESEEREVLLQVLPEIVLSPPLLHLVRPKLLQPSFCIADL
jgi:hypothetical protein